MDATSDTNEKTISDLPSEALSHIFSFLPDNIKVVRLVCSKWNDSCNIRKVSGHEKIVVTPEQVDQLFCSKAPLRNIFNLQLTRITLTADHVGFFEKFGRNLRSLNLDRCGADRHGPILQFCENLDTLILLKCYSTIIHTFRRLDGSLVKTNIISLTINHGNLIKLSDETIDACFRICPRLRSLTLDSLRLTPLPPCGNGFYSFGDGEEPVFNRTDIISFDCLRHALAVRAASLVELNLISLTDIYAEQLVQIASLPGLRLRKLQLSRMHTFTNETIRKIVILHPTLQHFRTRGCLEVQLKGSEIWLNECSSITRLDISTYDRFVADGIALKNTLTKRSHLRELVLKTDQSRIIGINFKEDPGKFDHLNTLDIGVSDINYKYMLEKVPVNLQHLTLTLSLFPSMENLSKTLEFLSNRFNILETLKLSLDGHHPRPVTPYDEDCSHEEVSFGSMKRLRTLQLKVSSHEFCSTNVLKRFEAPNLRVLKLYGFGKIDQSSLRDLVKNYPLLECFNISTSSVMFMKVPSNVRIMSEWKKLNFFYHQKDEFPEVEYLRLHRRRGDDKKFTFIFP